MNAVYARQSVDRAESISIESQVEFCRYEMRGEPYKVYADKGYSGKNTDRPAFAALMGDIERGLVRKVVVYKLDRISRSILDFSNMMERFGRYRVEFVSTTEKFDTASPMGRAMLNICIVFAQLERETIQKRVADAYFSRSQKSFYMGGRVPYGFRLAPAVIGGVKTARYEVCPEEARQVQLIYELYARPGCSYGDIVRTFQANGILKNGKPWSRTRLGDVLRSPVYVRADLSIYAYYRDHGAAIVNDPGDFIGTNGCYFYHGRTPGGPGEGAAGGYLVLAPHEGIVPAELWLKCRTKCLEGQHARPSQKAKNTWLAGKVKCAVCGYALVEKRSPSARARYLLCSNRMNARACPGPGTIYADELEDIVAGELRKKLSQFAPLNGCKGKTADSEQTALQLRLAQVENELSPLLERLADADDAVFRYISERIGVLDGEKQALLERLSEFDQRSGTLGGAISAPQAVWDELSFDDRRRTADLLIRVIRAGSGHVAIEWRI